MRRSCRPTRRSSRPGEGLGAAVAAGLSARPRHALVVNADLPAATPAALRRLAEGGLALVEAADGTTNALSLPDLGCLRRCTARQRASRFRAHAGFATVRIPELEIDVDSDADLERLDAASGGARARCSPSRREGRAALRWGRRRGSRAASPVLAPGELTVIGNVGDDLEILGLHVSPDLDSLLYALGGLIDTERGWGAPTSWNALESAERWGGEDWFRLGDRDIGLHLVRAEALRTGVPLSEVTADLCRAGRGDVEDPPGDRRAAADVRHDPGGRFAFQEWFVGRRPRGRGRRRRLRGARRRVPAPAWSTRSPPPEAILFAPSNPYLSIGPILAVSEIRARSSAECPLGRREPARPRGGGDAVRSAVCSRAWPAAPHPPPRGSLRGADRRARDRRGGRSGDGRRRRSS